ncbi:MAG: adenylyl-sulfate kinase [Rickettsiales bacterium]|nr:adenylyl-sulfate kinase [Rickettsiales bacterium]
MTVNNLIRYTNTMSKEVRQKMLGQKPVIIWFTGLSGSGKSTLSHGLEQKLLESGLVAYVLDGDNVRQGLNKDLDFSDKGREENIRRISEVAKLMLDAGLIVISAFISPFEKDREFCRSIVADDEFVEVYLNCSLEECERRDVKGLYKRARAGEIKKFTGIDSPYEVPDHAELNINTKELSVEDSLAQILDYLRKKNIIS